MIPTQQLVFDFIFDKTRVNRKRILLDAQLRRDIGVDGDDADDLMCDFAKQFNVDMTGFDFDAHFGPEGLGCLPIIFFRSLRHKLRGEPPPSSVPITIRDLIVAAESHKWPLHYALNRTNSR